MVYKYLVLKLIFHINVYFSITNLGTKNLRGLSPQANYTDRATAACR
jgi:hypothetical protein